MYFDTHCHYDFKQFDEDRDDLLGEVLPGFGVSGVVNAGINLKSSKAGLALAKRYGYVYAALGFHPHNASQMRDGDLALFREMAKNPEVVAIGEIGLDFYYDHSPRDVQIKCFEQQLELACEIGLPVIVHSREACEQVFEILAAKRVGERVGGVLHCFAGTAALGEKYVDMGFYIGVGGVVTYKGGGENIRNIPIQRLVIETDCPYLAPVPQRGRRNDSQNLFYIAEKIGKILGKTCEEVAEVTTQNARKLFCIE